VTSSSHLCIWNCFLQLVRGQRLLVVIMVFSYVSWLQSVLVVSEPVPRVPVLGLDDRPEGGT